MVTYFLAMFPGDKNNIVCKFKFRLFRFNILTNLQLNKLTKFIFTGHFKHV